MDRTVGIAAIVFAALAVAGIWLAMSPTALTSAPGDIDGLRAIGAAMFGAGLAAFLVVTLHWDYHRHQH